MASSSSSAAHFSERTSDLSWQTGPEMESSRNRHWSSLDYSRTSSEWSMITNFKDFDMLKEHREWGRFFRDFPTLELGKKISEGAQADVYEARMTRDGPFTFVAKVMKGDASLQAFQAQWPIGMLSAYNSENSYVFDLPLMTILGGTVLAASRFWGRFAFVTYRRWGDLRLLIDRRMKLKRTTVGPFFIEQVIQLMSRIAEDMDGLHNKHDIIHRDLKASNVLVWGEFGDDVGVAAPSRDEKIGCVVADFECSVGVLGTGWWRAPEILEQSRGGIPSRDWKFTRASDVYSYGMTCYEIITGLLPFEGGSASEASQEIVSGCLASEGSSASEGRHEIVSGCQGSSASKASHEIISGCQGSSTSEASHEISGSLREGCSALDGTDRILDGWRPNLPVELPSYLRSIIMGCWQSDPKNRPNFSNICKMLKNKQGCNPTNVVIDNESDKNTTIIKVEQYDNLQPMPLLEALERLLRLQLWVSEAEVLQKRTATGMVVQRFEVTDGEGRKVCDENVVANILKVLSLPVKTEWIKERPEDAGLTAEGSDDGGFTVEGSDDADTTSESYLVHIMSKAGGTSLLGRISAILTKMKIQVHKVRSRSDIGHESALFMDASRMDLLLLNFVAKEVESESPVDCKIRIEKLASRYVGMDFPIGKLSDLRAPPSPPAMRIHVEDDRPGSLSVRVICLEKPEILVDVACSFSGSNIRIRRYKVPSYGGIKVPRSCMVEDTYFQDEDGERRTGFITFFNRHCKLGWNVDEYIIKSYIIKIKIVKDYVDRCYDREGSVNEDFIYLKNKIKKDYVDGYDNDEGSIGEDFIRLRNKIIKNYVDAYDNDEGSIGEDFIRLRNEIIKDYIDGCESNEGSIGEDFIRLRNEIIKDYVDRYFNVEGSVNEDFIRLRNKTIKNFLDRRYSYGRSVNEEFIRLRYKIIKDFVDRYHSDGGSMDEYFIRLRNKIIKDYVDRNYNDEGKVELICRVGFGDLMQRLYKNRLHVFSIDMAPLKYTKGLQITLFVVS